MPWPFGRGFFFRIFPFLGIGVITFIAWTVLMTVRSKPEGQIEAEFLVTFLKGKRRTAFKNLERDWSRNALRLLVAGLLIFAMIAIVFVLPDRVCR